MYLLLHLKELIPREDVTYSIDFYNLQTLSHLKQYLTFAEEFQDVVSELVRINLHLLKLLHFFFLDIPLTKRVYVVFKYINVYVYIYIYIYIQ